MDVPEISWENTLHPLNGILLDKDTRELVKNCVNQPTLPLVKLPELKTKSKIFPIRIPIKQLRCTALQNKKIPKDILEFNANSTYPIIHEAMLPLIAGFLRYKQKHGSSVEKAVFKNMTLIQFIQRLLEIRAVEFYGSIDRWRLMKDNEGIDYWEEIGIEDQERPLVLLRGLSSDEIKLSAMMIVSSHTEFMNDGSRENQGIFSSHSNSYEPRGVIMGVIGPRFQQLQLMEYQDIIITPLQNSIKNGYGPSMDYSPPIQNLRALWSRLYGAEYHPLYEEAAKAVESKDNRRYVALDIHLIFDVENYMKRTILSAEIILLEANERAGMQNKSAFLHVVGFGLGAWRISDDQEIYFLRAFEIVLKNMNGRLQCVSDVMFAYFRRKFGNEGGVDYIGNIKIHFGMREPSRKLVGADADKLLVVTYAWDNNRRHSDNDFWSDHSTACGNPAAQLSSQISELHNTRINPRACGANLHIASPEHGLLHISEYAKIHLSYGIRR